MCGGGGGGGPSKDKHQASTSMDEFLGQAPH